MVMGNLYCTNSHIGNLYGIHESILGKNHFWNPKWIKTPSLFTRWDPIWRKCRQNGGLSSPVLSVVKSCKTINEAEQQELLASLKKFEHLFEGTLGTWNTDPVDLELKDPNCKPCHAKPYPQSLMHMNNC